MRFNSFYNGGIIYAFLLLFMPFHFAGADTVYMAPDDFLREVFADPPKPALLWLDNAVQAKLITALGHPYPQARLRYWRAAGKSVWMLDEVGKEYPITAAFVIVDQHIERAQVLVYRETRGEEIHLPVFLRQFIGSHLDNDRPSNKIDGITGATLSVHAMERMAHAALLLNQLAQ